MHILNPLTSLHYTKSIIREVSKSVPRGLADRFDSRDDKCDTTVTVFLQVCQTHLTYGTVGAYLWRVSKGCVRSSTCLEMQAQNSQHCKNSPTPECVYCCSGSFCNYASTMPTLRKFSRPADAHARSQYLPKRPLLLGCVMLRMAIILSVCYTPPVEGPHMKQCFDVSLPKTFSFLLHRYVAF